MQQETIVVVSYYHASSKCYPPKCSPFRSDIISLIIHNLCMLLLCVIMFTKHPLLKGMASGF